MGDDDSGSDQFWTDRKIFGAGGVIMGGLGIATGFVSGLDATLCLIIGGGTALVVLIWIIRQVVGEMLLDWEVRRPLTAAEQVLADAARADALARVAAQRRQATAELATPPHGLPALED